MELYFTDSVPTPVKTAAAQKPTLGKTPKLVETRVHQKRSRSPNTAQSEGKVERKRAKLHGGSTSSGSSCLLDVLQRLPSKHHCFFSWLEALAKKEVVPPRLVEGVVRVGSDCVGLGTDFLALTLALPEVSLQQEFIAEIDPSKITLHECLRGFVVATEAAELVTNLGDVSKRDLEKTSTCDIFTSGAPCPPWSIAGSREGLRDPRGLVILWSLAYVLAKRPRVALFENVAGLLGLSGCSGDGMVEGHKNPVDGGFRAYRAVFDVRSTCVMSTGRAHFVLFLQRLIVWSFRPTKMVLQVMRRLLRS